MKAGTIEGKPTLRKNYTKDFFSGYYQQSLPPVAYNILQWFFGWLPNFVTVKYKKKATLFPYKKYFFAHSVNNAKNYLAEKTFVSIKSAANVCGNERVTIFIINWRRNSSGQRISKGISSRHS